MMTINALVAAPEAILPVDMSVFSVRGMVKLMGTMQAVRKVNPDLPPPRIVACRTDNTTVGKAIEEGLRNKFGGASRAPWREKPYAFSPRHLTRKQLLT